MTFIKEIIGTAFSSLWTRKLRTFLSVLGIVIGILTVSALLTVALSVRKEITKSIGTLGANFVGVVPGKMEGGNIGSSLGASTLTENDFNSLKTQLPEAQDLAMASLLSGNIKFNDKEISTGLILGASPGAEKDFNFTLENGRLLTEGDEYYKTNYVVLGNKVKEELFGADFSPIGQTIYIRNKPFIVIGTLQNVSSGFNLGGPDFNSVVLMPIHTAWEISGTKQIFRIMMHSPEGSDMNSFKDKIKQIVLANHGGEEDFSVFAQEDILKVVDTILNLITSLLSAIAAISLVVGGIGIMNTMLVSVSERTREIGIRKAVGATRGAILFQFLVESVMLTFMGGLVAVLIFGTVFKLAGPHIPIPLSIDWRVIGGALLFSAIVGIVFGVFPAYQASRKDPIVALRYE